MKPSSFHIYDASAGSGKTYTLVKEYLKILFGSTKKEPYKYILAITFTNKAVGEMKERIIDTLKAFSSKDILQSSDSMFDAISKELNIQPEVLHHKSKHLLETIVHNYAAFDVSTIDKFNQKLIRTFAYDLKLPLNFEVELDTDAVLSEAVDNLIAKAGSDADLTKTLVDFAIEKADDDRSWDIAFDFNQIAKLLTKENDAKAIEALNDKTLDDFNALRSNIKKKSAVCEHTIIEKANDILTLIEECGLEVNDFSRGSLPKHFQKLTKGFFNVPFGSAWQNDLEHTTLYPKRVTEDIASIIEDIQPRIADSFNDTKTLIFKHKLFQAIKRNVTPLSVLNSISKEVQALKDEQNMLLISEFNAIISEHIKEQPAPFIYERIGEKFKHYFIDEFQDTSVMQWENLIPLIDNALSTQDASAMIVGDAKQAIYRWRGGNAEQFLELIACKNPFQAKKYLHYLEENYRSFKAVIDFNNGFFEHIASYALGKDSYKTLYQNAHQNKTIKDEGYVDITFLEIKEDDKNERYAKHVLNTITHCLEKGFQQKDICVLVRKKKEGIAIADYLNTHSDLNIMSSETLLISNSPEVTFIIDVLHLILEPNNNEIKIDVLHYLADHKFKIADKHPFFEKLIAMNAYTFYKELNTYGVFFNYNDVLELSLYEAVERIIHDFNLVETSDAYVQYFLDTVIEYMQKHQSSILGFLEYYDRKKETLSIVSPNTIDAVQIMTIHKAKGLEFPVVIFPFANLDLYKENNPKAWLSIDKEDFNGFEQMLINYSKDLEHFGDPGKQIYINRQSELELDNINILYVALTRAVAQLYIISDVEFDSKGNVKENLNRYSGLLIHYLKHLELWRDDQLTYGFGKPNDIPQTNTIATPSIEQGRFISTPKKDLNVNVITNAGYLWDTSQQDAIERGNLIHLILSLIKTKTDINFAFDHLLQTGIINLDQVESLKSSIEAIVDHPDLRRYFNSNHIIYNERDIISKNGQTIRPDRLVIKPNNEAILIDYKTGAFQESHHIQLLNYKMVVEEMNLKVSKAILIYINDDIDIKEV